MEMPRAFHGVRLLPGRFLDLLAPRLAGSLLYCPFYALPSEKEERRGMETGWTDRHAGGSVRQAGERRLLLLVGWTGLPCMLGGWPP